MKNPDEPGDTHPLIRVEHVSKTFRSPRRRLFQPRAQLQALDDVSLVVHETQSLAIVGESGSGKSSLLRVMLGLLAADTGTITVDGRSVTANPRDRMLWLRRQTGFVFQDPYSSLNPRMPVRNIIAEPLEALSVAGNHGARVAEMLDQVGLPQSALEQYPHEFSGGQRQRIALARALVHRPRILLGDEPVSALDVLARGTILELLTELQRELSLTLVTVTHDLAILQQIAQHISVMRRGVIVESGPLHEVLNHPQHEYTQSLIDSVPRLP